MENKENSPYFVQRKTIKKIAFPKFKQKNMICNNLKKKMV